MGYRLEIYKKEHFACGGKMFGYMSPDDLPKCKSWCWLRDNGYIDEDDEDCWDYSFSHTTELWGDRYKQFIKLYLEDYIKYGYNCQDTIDELKKTIIETKDTDQIIIEWG